jgi:hypothetical protein
LFARRLSDYREIPDSNTKLEICMFSPTSKSSTVVPGHHADAAAAFSWDTTPAKSTVVPGHHADAAAAFSWDTTPAKSTVVPGHHADAAAAFSWDA